ncbi:MAG: TetR/AcrR family transcriptional regulator [Treponema sp.]|nr:TetR/AcrR family transcriptional regulator [Treponema sp.]
MSKKQITKEKIIQSFLSSAVEKSAGATSLADISDVLQIKKASLYNHFESRDEMYSATLEFCASEILASTFVTKEHLEAASLTKTQGSALFKKVITSYFKLFEGEPFLKMYVFIHAEQYYNSRAMEIVDADYKRLVEDVKSLMKALKSAKKAVYEEKDSKDIAQAIVSVMTNQLDAYISQKKEIIRRNPDTGLGSLFTLPTDENLLNRSIHVIEVTVKNLLSC